MNTQQLRNFGISAHIDAGKTTLSERILYYAGKIHRMQEVRGAGATMDHMDLERERGITITSAATTVEWQGHALNLIDTPGHVDFTVEVERSLRVLDGAVLVLCAVGGVQSQTMTVAGQMKRYHVPRLAVVNKMDRTGADYRRVVGDLREKLDCDAVLMQLPIGEEEHFDGIVDLVSRRAIYFDGDAGENVRNDELPSDMVATVDEARQQLLESLAMYSDELMELLLAEDPVPEELVHDVLGSAVQEQDLTPVFLASAYRNRGVQPLLDAIVRYLPSPQDREMTARPHDESGEPVLLAADTNKPLVAMAFKLVDDPYGQLTFTRIYQGTLAKGKTYYNQRTRRKERVSRILRMHADERTEIDQATAGDIVAVLGVDAASGDTICAEQGYCLLESMHVPEPVIRVAVRPTTRDAADRLGKALARFGKEDPTFKIVTDQETGETLIAGMGELHLDVYVERIRREYRAEVEVGAPKVSYREAPTRATKFNHKHRKQTGGSGQFAHIVGQFQILEEEAEASFVFEESVVGGRIPRQYIPAVERGFREILVRGPLAGFPIVGLKAVLEDGSHHEVDSSDMAFQTAARNCLRESFARTNPVLLEPVMKIEIEVPGTFQGPVAADLTSRRGMILATDMTGSLARIEGEVPLAAVFGYATELRSMTQGQGIFTMEFARYRQLPPSLARDVIAERKAELAGAR